MLVDRVGPVNPLLAPTRAVAGVDGDAGVTPYRAWDLDWRVWCQTRVQELGVGGGLSNAVHSNLKSEEITPTGRLQRALWFQGRFQSRWTAPRMKSDSCPAAWAGDVGQWQERNRTVCPVAGPRAGRAGWDGDGMTGSAVRWT